MDERARTPPQDPGRTYIADGSRSARAGLSKFSGLDLSPATIRNVMADLEEAGFIASPHTSAGRVPTPRLSLFVRQPAHRAALEAQQMGEMEEACRRSLAARSSTPRNCSPASPILPASSSPRAGRQPYPPDRVPQPVGKRILLIIVTTDGDVQNRILSTDKSRLQPSGTGQCRQLPQPEFRRPDFEQIRRRWLGRDPAAARRHQAADDAGPEAGEAFLRKTPAYVISGERTCSMSRNCRPT